MDKEENRFRLYTNQGEYLCKNVIVATGPFQEPYIPESSQHLSENILQLHSSKYKNPSQLQDGTTLVVGGGNSGAQIAVEISHIKNVYLSVGQPIRYLPQDIGSKSIFWWFDKLGVLKANVNSKVGQFIKNKPDPIFGFELKGHLKSQDIIIKPRVTTADRNRVSFENATSLEVSNIIWSTGFKSVYNWINIPSIFNEEGMPIHKRGITTLKGLCFLGLPWQYRRGSALLQGVGYDAEYLIKKLF